LTKVHNGQQKPNLRCKKKGVKWIGRPNGSKSVFFYGDAYQSHSVETAVSLEVTTEGVRTGTSMERQRERDTTNYR